jgi:hypothetical protein
MSFFSFDNFLSLIFFQYHVEIDDCGGGGNKGIFSSSCKVNCIANGLFHTISSRLFASAVGLENKNIVECIQTRLHSEYILT